MSYGTISGRKECCFAPAHEFTKMYPAFIEEAKKEGADAATMSFSNANAVEEIHAGLYQEALDNLGNNDKVDYWVCQHCGNTVEGEAPDKCPICGRPQKMFKKIE